MLQFDADRITATGAHVGDEGSGTMFVRPLAGTLIEDVQYLLRRRLLAELVACRRQRDPSIEANGRAERQELSVPPDALFGERQHRVE